MAALSNPTHQSLQSQLTKPFQLVPKSSSLIYPKYPMKHFVTLTLITFAFLPHIGQAQATHTGTVEQVWEDGFRLHTAEQTLWVDTANLSGENTPANIAVGDRVSVTGELGRIEFDAAAITVATLSR